MRVLGGPGQRDWGRLRRNSSKNGDWSVKNAQLAREHHKPNVVKVLYVAESPPEGGTFFYYGNSNLYFAVLEAFKSVLGKDINIKSKSFLEFFKDLGCYLEDLCEEPVNNLPKIERLKKRVGGIDGLSSKIRNLRPEVVVILMKEIQPEVKEAIRRSGHRPDLIEVTPFPAHSEQNRLNCVRRNAEILESLVNLGILERIAR